jgi:hypothetical protein
VWETGIERWDSGSEGNLAARGVAEDEEAAAEASPPVAVSVSSWGGNDGDMILFTDTQ